MFLLTIFRRSCAWQGRLVCALLLATLIGCQYLPTEPSPEHVPANSALLQLPAASAGVLVLPVADAPATLARPLASAMADALRDADVAADTDSSNRRSLRLQGTLEAPGPGRDAGALHRVRWRVLRADGSTAGEAVQSIALPARDWAKPSAEILADLAHTQAPALAALIQDPAPREVAEAIPTVLLYPVAGAPGDGTVSLTLALARALAQVPISVVDPTRPARPGAGGPKTADALAIAGSVSVGPPKARQQHVKITWSVLDQNGTSLGSIDQENDVPAGTLDGAWGEVAPVVAQAALGGIVPLLQRLSQTPPA